MKPSLGQRMMGDRKALWWMLLAAGIWAIASSCHGQVTNAFVRDSFIQRIGWLESRNNDLAKGQHGEVGRHQLMACAVKHVNATYGWTKKLSDMKDPAISTAYCRAYLHILAKAVGTTDEKVLRYTYVRGPTAGKRKAKR